MVSCEYLTVLIKVQVFCVHKFGIWYSDICVCVREHILRMCSRSRAFPSSRLGKFAFTRMTLAATSTPTQSTSPRSKSPKYSVSATQWIAKFFGDCDGFAAYNLIDGNHALIPVWREVLLHLHPGSSTELFWRRSFSYFEDWRMKSQTNKNKRNMSDFQSIFQCNALQRVQFVWKEVISLRAINMDA